MQYTYIPKTMYHNMFIKMYVICMYVQIYMLRIVKGPKFVLIMLRIYEHTG